MIERDKHYWNNEAFYWSRSRALGEKGADARDFIQSEVRFCLPATTDELVLNLGGGNDDESLVEWEGKVITLDYARRMLEHPRIKHPVEANAKYTLPFADESVGLVTSFLLMRYLSLSQQRQLIAEANRVLKKDGYLVIVDVPNNEHAFQVETFDPNRFDGLAESLGVEIVKAEISERNVGKFIGTEFGGRYEKGSYRIGVLILKKA